MKEKEVVLTDLNSEWHILAYPVRATIQDFGPGDCVAEALGLTSFGDTMDEAIANLKANIIQTYEYCRGLGEERLGRPMLEIWRRLRAAVREKDSEQTQRFTRDEVSAILCEGCRLHIPEVRNLDNQAWYHVVNGQQIRCLATTWRNRTYRADEKGRDAHQLSGR